MLQEGVSDDKAVGRLRCQLHEILVPIGKGRFQPIDNEYRGHSADTYYLRIVKRMPLAAGVHKPLMGITPKNSLVNVLQTVIPAKSLCPYSERLSKWQRPCQDPQKADNGVSKPQTKAVLSAICAPSHTADDTAMGG